MLNLKPARFGSVRRLFNAYDYCAAHDIGAYGGACSSKVLDVGSSSTWLRGSIRTKVIGRFPSHPTRER
jgi:methylaspartate ammonia-lyase